MKKIIMGALAAVVITTGATAEDSFFDYKKEIGLGVSLVSFNEYFDDGTGININGKLMTKLNDNIALGAQLGYSYTDTDYIGFQAEFYMLEILPTITYIVNDKLDISAMVGYTTGKFEFPDWNSEYDYDGMTYGAG